MKRIRCFIAVEIPDEVKSSLGRTMGALKSFYGRGFKWVNAANLHITLKFLGEVPHPDIQGICSKIEEIAGSVYAFDLSLGSAGAFPSWKAPRVLWIGTEKGAQEMSALAEKTEDAMAKLGFEKEKRVFKVHITVGRARKPVGIHNAGGAIPEIKTGGKGFKVTGMHLIRSILTPAGPVYSRLFSAGLKN